MSTGLTSAMSQGHIDICQQVAITGWAIRDGDVATVAIRCNDSEMTRLETSLPRSDVNDALGVPGTFGFSYRFPRSIRASDRLTFAIVGTDVQFDAAPHLDRVARLTYGIEPEWQGIELGALDRPFLDTTHFNVNYVDHASRQDLIRKYKSTGTLDTITVDDIVETDIVWSPGQRLTDCAAGRTFHYAVASQTMEHVANPIGWLNQIAECVRPGGRINLSLPDKRRTFDHARALSTASDMIDAFEHCRDRPPFRAVFDHIVNVANPPDTRKHDAATLRQAYEVARMADRGEYVDVHCHVWTSESFAECWSVIDLLGICRAKLDRIWPPAFASNEFIVSFSV